MPAGVGTGLEPRASVGPLVSDVGFKETHLLVDPGLSLGHLPLGLAWRAFARGEVVFIFSFKIFTFSKETGRYWTYFTVIVCI